MSNFQQIYFKEFKYLSTIGSINTYRRKKVEKYISTEKYNSAKKFDKNIWTQL